MCGIEREIEKKRLGRVLVDVTDGPIAERVREVRHRRGGLHAVEERIRHARANIDMGNIHIRMVTAEEPVELFKSRRIGCNRSAEPRCHFPNRAVWYPAAFSLSAIVVSVRGNP